MVGKERKLSEGEGTINGKEWKGSAGMWKKTSENDMKAIYEERG